MKYAQRRADRKRRLDQKNGIARIVISGDPIAQARPRACIRGKRAGVYSTQQKQAETYQVKALEQWPRPPLNGALEVTMFFYLKRPKSHFGTGRNAGTLKVSAPNFHTKTPDSSNLAKFAEDALNGVLWQDDAQITSLTALKRYVEPGGSPATVINVRTL